MRSRRPFFALRTFAVLAVALAPLVLGCGDDKDKKGPEAAAPPNAAFALQGGPIGEIVPPASVVAWGGADTVDRLAAGAQAFAQQISPLVPPVQETLNGELRRRLALTKLEGVDWSKPARLALFDPKGMPKAVLALVLTLSGKDQFLATLPAVKKENDEGNAITYRDDLGRTICLNFVNDTVVVTWEKKQFPTNIEFFVRLAKSTVGEGQTFNVSATNVSALYAKEIEDMIAQAKQQVTTGAMAVSPMQGEVSSRVLTWMVSTFKDLERVEVVPKLPEDGATLAIRLHPRAGSELAKSFRSIKARPHTLLSRIPADATMFASFSTDPDATDSLTTRFIEWAMTINFGTKVPEGYGQAMREYFQATGGEMVVAAHKPISGDGLALTTLLSVRDEQKLRDAMRKSKLIFKDKDVVEASKKMGTTIEYKENAYKVGAVPVDVVEVKYEKGKNPLAQLGPFGEALSELTTSHMATSKDLSLIAYGKDGRKGVEAFLGGKVQGGLDKAAGPVRAFRMAAKEPVGIFYISPIEMAKRASLGGKNPLADGLKDLASTTGAALSFSATDGVLEILLDVPVEQARNLFQGVARAKALLPQ